MSEELNITPEAAAPTESMDDYAAELEASFKQIREGDILTGTVIGVSENGVTLDLKYYTDGLIRPEDFSIDPSFNLKENVHVGDEISATVIRRDDGEGHILQAGVVAYVEGIRGFIPASKLSLNYVEDLDEWLGREIQVQVITVDEESKKLVLSAKELLREKEAEERKAKVSNVEVGLVTEGTVESVKDYGAFVDLGNGLSGLVHVSQISDKRVKNPASVLKPGDKVKVKVIAVKDGKLSLSMKALKDVAAEEIQEEAFDLPQTEELGTSLGSLFANLKF